MNSYSFCCEGLMARQHYATLPGSTASYAERIQSVHSKITLTYTAVWLSRRIRPFLCSNFLCHYCSKKKNLPERAPTKTRCRLSIDAQLRAWAHQQSAYVQLSPLPSLCPLCHSRDKLFQALSRFSVLQVTKNWARPRNEARFCPYSCKIPTTCFAHAYIHTPTQGWSTVTASFTGFHGNSFLATGWNCQQRLLDI